MSKKQNSLDTKAGYYGYSSETTSAANHAKSNSGSKKSVKAKDQMCIRDRNTDE